MARFIPIGQTSDYHGSPGERMVYSAFKKLPDDYVVFYSMKWGLENDGRYKNGEADFLVFDPKRGFLVIEVKGGGIKCSDDGRWYSVDHRKVGHPMRCSPLVQAWRSVERFKDLLERSSEKTVQRYRISPTVWFPNVKRNEIQGKLPTEYQPSITFTEPDLDDPLGAIERAFNGYGFKEIELEKPVKQAIEDVVKVFAPSFRIVPSVSSELKERDFLFNQLTNEQASLLDYLVEQRTAGIHGASGTGKTMIALECARRLPKDTNVLFLCFNKLILKYLKEKFAEEMPNVTFANLNQLYARAGGYETADTEVITDFLLGEFSDNYQFEHIIVDEGQDFAADHLDFLLDITKATGGYFYVFYDKNQLVHKWDQETIEWLKKLDCRLVLNKNCRNTYQIAKTAYAPIDIENVVLAERINGDVPQICNYPLLERAIEGIADTIRYYTTEKGFTRKQVTILTLKTLEKTFLAGRESIGGYRLTNDLDGDGVLFTTARKYKGLESDVVIVIDFDENTFKDDNAKNVFYVASSRAKHFLSFVTALDENAMRKIVSDLGENSGGDLRKTIRNRLSVGFRDLI